jgi:hypothetical protein
LIDCSTLPNSHDHIGRCGCACSVPRWAVRRARGGDGLFGLGMAKRSICVGANRQNRHHILLSMLFPLRSGRSKTDRRESVHAHIKSVFLECDRPNAFGLLKERRFDPLSDMASAPDWKSSRM